MNVVACVSDCQKSLAEHGLLADDMKGVCATPKLQQASYDLRFDPNLTNVENRHIFSV